MSKWLLYLVALFGLGFGTSSAQAPDVPERCDGASWRSSSILGHYEGDTLVIDAQGYDCGHTRVLPFVTFD